MSIWIIIAGRGAPYTPLPGGEAPPFSTIQNTTTLTDGITKQRRSHLLRFGFYDVYATYNNQTTGEASSTVDPRTYINGSTQNEFADLLLGNVAGFDQSSQNVMANLVNKRFDFYAQDTWKATSRLTLNYGARLDHIAWWYDKNGQIAVFNAAAYDPTQPISAASGMQTHATNSAIPISGAKPLHFQFAPSIHLETSYVGNTTRHLNGYTALNLTPLGSEKGPYFGSYYADLARPTNLTTPNNPRYEEIGVNRHNLDSNYHSLQVTASRSRGWLNTWLTYTYGKALAYNCEDPFNEHNCYAPAPFDRSQAINVSYYIILPSVSQKYFGNHPLGNAALDGWQISGIEQYGSGTPFTDIAQGGTLHNEYGGNQIIGIYGTTGPGPAYHYNDLRNDVVNGTPDEAAVPFVSCDPRQGLKAHQYFNPSCFTSPSQGHNGTFRIPYIHGPAYFNDELGIFKDFKIRDTGKLQIRFQGFNFLNRSFDTYQQCDSSLYLGFHDVGIAPDNTTSAGVTTTRTGHRTLQAAAKFYF